MPAYFTPDLFRFLGRLKRNNDREWFQARKDEFEACVRQPALRFITEFAGPLYEISPYLIADPRPTRGSLFRIYRDTRFSPDKRPYKTHLPCGSLSAGRMFTHPAFTCILSPVDVSRPAACGIPSRQHS
jgi:uncharacterized protein (TIGR02453 family)